MNKLLPLLASLTLFASCNLENLAPTLNKKEVTLYTKETAQLIVDGSSDVRWESSDKYVATVDYTGQVTANKVGTATITAKHETGTLACALTVNPIHQLYVEPIKEFNSSKTQIKAKEKRPLNDETATALVYDDPTADLFMYMFENNRMTGAGVVLPLRTDAKKVAAFLIERYEVVGEVDDVFLFSGKDAAVGLTIKTSGFFIVYVAPGKETTMGVDRVLASCRLASKAISDEDSEAVRQAKEQLKALLTK